jgi:hypothetical protein
MTFARYATKDVRALRDEMQSVIGRTSFWFSQMPLMLEKLYDALRTANVPEEKARAVAVEGANFEKRLTKAEAKLVQLEWMDGFTLAATLIILWKVFLH